MRSLLDKVYVVHVTSGFEDRRKSIVSQMAKHGINFEFYLKYDIPAIKPDDIEKYFLHTHSLSNAELSCSLKHIGIHTEIVKNNHLRTLVLEDDVLLSANFSTTLDQLLARVDRIEKGCCISLGNAGNLYVEPFRRRTGQLLYEADRHRATDSYLIDYKAAKARVDYISTHKTALPTGHMFNHVDKAVGNAIYWLHPTIVQQGSQDGTMRSAVSKNKRFHKLRWLIRDANKKLAIRSRIRALVMKR